MSDPTFNSVRVRRATGAAVNDFVTLDSVDINDGNGAALRFLNNSATDGLALTLGRLSVQRVSASTVRLDLAVAPDPSVSSSDATTPLLSLVSAVGGLSVTTAAGSTLAAGGTLTVSGATTLGGTLAVSGAATLNSAALSGSLGVGGAATLTSATLSGPLTVAGTTTLNGALNISGSVGIGTSSPQRQLHVEGSEIHSGGASGGFSFSNRGSAFANDGSNGQRWVLYAGSNAARLWAGEDKLVVAASGALSLRNSENNFVTFTGTKYDNENTLRKNNLKLVMGSSGFIIIGAPPLEYEFAVGHTVRSFSSGGGGFVFSTRFNKVFSVNQDGTAYFAGGKGGYVVDHFINRVGDTLEQGDVVVIGPQQSGIFTGVDNNIPLPEVDLTTTAYDRRVCGIVARVVTEGDLPSVAPTPEELTPPPDVNLEEATQQPYVHPLGGFAASAADDLDPTKVQDQQMGLMVTLGAFAHCKVDADIAPIEAGDLLTSSPTPGHAQKVLDPAQAAGAIIGKALGALAQGKGKIPVMVLLQ